MKFYQGFFLGFSLILIGCNESSQNNENPEWIVPPLSPSLSQDGSQGDSSDPGLSSSSSSASSRSSQGSSAQNSTPQGARLDSIVPDHGIQNQRHSVTLSGAGFTVGTEVRVGGVLCENVQVIGDAVIHCDVPVSVQVGAVDVEVRVPGQPVLMRPNGFRWDLAPARSESASSSTVPSVHRSQSGSVPSVSLQDDVLRSPALTPIFLEEPVRNSHTSTSSSTNSSQRALQLPSNHSSQIQVNSPFAQSQSGVLAYVEQPFSEENIAQLEKQPNHETVCSWLSGTGLYPILEDPTLLDENNVQGEDDPATSSALDLSHLSNGPSIHHTPHALYEYRFEKNEHRVQVFFNQVEEKLYILNENKEIEEPFVLNVLKDETLKRIYIIYRVLSQDKIQFGYFDFFNPSEHRKTEEGELKRFYILKVFLDDIHHENFSYCEKDEIYFLYLKKVREDKKFDFFIIPSSRISDTVSYADFRFHFWTSQQGFENSQLIEGVVSYDGIDICRELVCVQNSHEKSAWDEGKGKKIKKCSLYPLKVNQKFKKPKNQDDAFNKVYHGFEFYIQHPEVQEGQPLQSEIGASFTLSFQELIDIFKDQMECNLFFPEKPTESDDGSDDSSATSLADLGDISSSDEDDDDEE